MHIKQKKELKKLGNKFQKMWKSNKIQIWKKEKKLRLNKTIKTG